VGQNGPRVTLAAQARSRAAIRRAVRRYAALRAAAGQHTDTVTVTLRDGTKAVALINIDLVPDPTQEP
jgi:hypothetical protein